MLDTHLPVGLPRRVKPPGVCGIEVTKRARTIDAVNEGEWRKIKVGVDSCAAISVTPPGCFPGPVEVTDQVGDEYTSASNDIMYNQGQQRVDGVTENYLPCNLKVQVTDVNKPLIAASDMEDQGNTIVLSKKWGHWLVNDNTGTSVPLNRENGTYNMDVWFLAGMCK